MEDTKLKNNTKVNDNVLKRSFVSRRGFILPMAMVIILAGSAVIAAIYAISTSFFSAVTPQKQVYEDRIDMVGYIEQIKGSIIAENEKLASDDKPVLHGSGGASGTVYFEVKKLDDLKLSLSSLGLSDTITLPSRQGRRQIKVEVYDANYDLSKVSFTTGTPGPGFPPCLRPADLEPDELLYKRFGAYVIRLKLYGKSDAKPLHEIETAFTCMTEAKKP